MMNFPKLLLLLLFSFTLIPLFSQSSSPTIDSITIDIEVLKSEVKDSLGLEGVIEKISINARKPSVALRYVIAYEEIVENTPSIPNRMEHAHLLRANAYNNLAWNNNRTNIPQALLYIDSALIWHEMANSEAGYWKDQYGLGVIYRNKGDNQKALEYFDSYYKQYAVPYDSTYIANVQFQRAAVFFQLGQLQDATRAILEAIAIDEAKERNFSLASNLNVLAIIKKKSKLFDEVIPIYDKVYAIRKEIGDIQGQGNVLYNKANFLAEKGNVDDAFSVFRQAEQVAKSSNLLSYIYEGLGTNYFNIENIDSAEHYLRRSYDLRKNSGNDREIYIIRHKLGQINASKGNLNQAAKEFQFAYNVAEQQGEKDKINQIAHDYAKVLERQGNYKKANYYLNKHLAVKDSLVNKSISESVEDITVKYETEKKEQEILLLNSQNEVSELMLNSSRRTNKILMGGLALFGLLTFFIIYQWKKIKTQNGLISIALEDKDTLLREIHHRVKNNLQVISALLTLQSSHLKDIQAKEALKEGQDRVQSMALIHKDLYQHDNLKGVNTKDYLEQLIENLFQSYRVDEGSFELETDIEEINLDVDTMIPMGLMINELISNALKHAYKAGQDKNLFVSLKEEANILHLNIRDNGKGVEDIDLMKKQSFGYSLIQSFARKLEAEVEITNDNGLSIKLLIQNYQRA